jgi:hypothetical protein
MRLAFRATSLSAHAGFLVVGLENGPLLLLQEDRRLPILIETGARKPIVAMASSRTDFYSATEDEVQHWGAAEGIPQSPTHTERTLPFSTRTLVLFPGAGLLVIGSREARLLHPVHLASLSHVDIGGDIIVDGCGNTRLVALLLHRPGGSRLVAHIFQRRETRGLALLRSVESFELRPGSWRGISFLGPDADELVVIGDDVLAIYPSRRERPRGIDLQVSSAVRRYPPARVLAVPGHHALLVAYGDGSLESIDLISGDRRIHLDGPENLDPLVGFACRGKVPGAPGAPWTAWLLHASGLLRTVRPGGGRTHT